MPDRSSTVSPPPRAWHQRAVEEVAASLGLDLERGLSSAEAARRQQQYGPNQITSGQRRGAIQLLLHQFTDFMILLLVAAAVLSGFLGDVEDTIAILVIVLINAAIGFSQEYRAQRAIEALRRMSQPLVRLRRDGEAGQVPTPELVPGDLVYLEAGNLVPADLRLWEAVRLRIEESALTGESEAVHKSADPLDESELPLGDRVNMAYRGTVVTQGRATGIVVATGMQTELGRIATLLERQPETRTPLQQRLARFSSKLAAGFLVLCAVVFTVGVLRGEPVPLMLLTAVSLAVAAIPEALPAVVTLALAFGARRMVQREALVRTLPAVETLGSVTWIGSDKTGTLTQNRMQVARTEWADSGAQPNSTLQRLFFAALLLNNDTRSDSQGRLLGDPTETALYTAALAAGLDASRETATRPRIGEIPFDAARRRMTTLHPDGPAAIAFTKGSPEAVLPLCRHQMGADGQLHPVRIDEWLQRAEQMAADGLRVLAIACRRFPHHPRLDATLEDDLILLGLIGLIDPPRPEAASAVATCRRAGITPVMITGDHPRTARAIAHSLGILDGEADDVLTGVNLERLDDEELDNRLQSVRVFARVAPEQKIRIIEALQRRGAFVAMTGDGVNDAPALRRADIGVAMGQAGTDVAREAADLVLLDDNFATIVAAIAEGRRIFDNIRRFVRYVMTCNSAEIWTLFLAPFFGLPIPLQPIQILWINLITDGLPGLALTAEPAEEDLLARPPRPPQESLFAHGMGAHMMGMGLLMAALTLGTQVWAIHIGDAHWQTMTFTVLTLVQMGHVLAIRSERQSLFHQGFGSNLPLLGAVILTVLLQMAVIYLPFAQPIFHTTALSLPELLVCTLCAFVLFGAVELEKLLRRRKEVASNRS